MKKLYRSTDNVIISGILGGIAEYLEIDPVVVRVIFILLTCITGFFPGIVFYFVALWVIPYKGRSIHDIHTPSKESGNPSDKPSTTEEETVSH